MLDSINIGIAGMHAYSSGLKTISNNVANMNTLGFKAKTSSFSDLVGPGSFAQGALRSGNYQQFGSGVSYGSTLLNFKPGDLKSTSGDLDLALNGRGFFMLTDANGQKIYVRTGQFELKDGNIVQSGTKLQLQIRTTKGTITGATTKGLEISQPKASTVVTFSGNMSVDPTMVTDQVIQSVNVIDNLGGTHVLSVTIAAATTQNAAGTMNEKEVSIKDDKGNVLKTGKISFSRNAPAGVADAATAKLSVDIAAVGGSTSTVSFDFSACTGNSSGSTSTVAAKPADGYGMGSIASVTGTAEGKLEITYTNGQKETLGDIVVADFDNLQDLEELGGGQYRYAGSGTPIYGHSGQNGLGDVKTKSLEGSNVNLSDEFGDLILVQRGFQASSQIISTANEMLGHVFELRSQR